MRCAVLGPSTSRSLSEKTLWGTLIEALSTELVIAAAIALCSGLIHGYTGFGTGPLMIPLFALLLGPVEAIAIASIIVTVGTLPLYPGAVRNARWPEMLPIGLATLFTTPLGIYLLFSLDPEITRRAMGVVVFFAGLILMSGWSYRGPRGVFPSAAAGAVAGSLAGAVGLGGPALAVYFLAAPQPEVVQRANIVVSIGIVVAIALALLAYAGGVTIGTIERTAILIPVYIFGTWSGNRLFTVAPREYFRRVALWLLLVIGAAVALA